MTRTDRFPVDDATGPSEGFALDRIFAGLETAKLLLAVSGGPDSVALMGMAARWARSLGTEAPALHVATVDHGLRPASGSEAERVAEAAAALRLPHAILRWEGPKPKTAVQERARAARYALLAAQARAVGATHILTGHHANDQAETVLLRLMRGSGVTGLAGMRRDTALAPGLRLVRPLLGLRKADLAAVCVREGLDTIHDPSNVDPNYTRTGLRAQAATLASLGLDVPALLRLAERMARADDALDAETRRVEQLLAPARADGLYRAGFAAAAGAQAVIVGRLLQRAVEHAVPGGGFISLRRLEALTTAVCDALAAGRPHRATLAGARIVCGRDGVIEVAPEPTRRRGRAPSRQFLHN